MLEGRVEVNGATVRELGSKADPARDDIRVDGRRVKVVEQHRYLLLNKPRGYVTTRSDPERRQTVVDLIRGVREYVYPVGRLDYESEGLILLTNDGELAARLTHPSHGLSRVHDPHAALRDDVRLLGGLLGDTLRAREGDAFFERVEEVRAIAKRAHEGERGQFDRLADLLRGLPLASAVPVARAFAHFLTLANIAEQHHRVRRRREYARAPERQPQPGSCEETFPRLLASGVEPSALAAAVAALRI